MKWCSVKRFWGPCCFVVIFFLMGSLLARAIYLYSLLAISIEAGTVSAVHSKYSLKDRVWIYTRSHLSHTHVARLPPFLTWQQMQIIISVYLNRLNLSCQNISIYRINLLMQNWFMTYGSWNLFNLIESWLAKLKYSGSRMLWQLTSAFDRGLRSSGHCDVITGCWGDLLPCEEDNFSWRASPASPCVAQKKTMHAWRTSTPVRIT